LFLLEYGYFNYIDVLEHIFRNGKPCQTGIQNGPEDGMEMSKRVYG
jgi:hypothetical protein